MPYESDERVVVIDLLAQMKLTKLVIPYMKEAGFGHIIFTDSMYGRFVTGGFASYCAAKHGLRAFAEGIDRKCLTSVRRRVRPSLLLFKQCAKLS